MLAIDVGFVFEEGITQSHDNVLGRSQKPNFKVDLSFFWHRMGTIDNQKIRTYFCEEVILGVIIFNIRTLRINLKLKYLPILLTLTHKTIHPLTMDLKLLLLCPLNPHLLSQQLLNLFFFITRPNIYLITQLPLTNTL